MALPTWTFFPGQQMKCLFFRPSKERCTHATKFPKDIAAHLTKKYGKNVRTECRSMTYLHRTESHPESVETMPCATLMKACFPGYRIQYINLDRRQDRKKLLLDEFAKQGINNFLRIQAVEKNPRLPSFRAGSLACAQSHLRALQGVVSPVGVVAEDDVMFVSPMPKAELERPSFGWDVLMLAYNGKVDAATHSAHGQRWCRSGGQLLTTSLYRQACVQTQARACLKPPGIWRRGQLCHKVGVLQ